MVPSEVPGDDDAQQGSSGKEHERNGGDSQPEHSGSELATAAAPLSTPDGEIGANAHTSAMDASLGGERSAAGKEEFVDITIDYLELTSKSPAVAQTLYRGDEAAYRAACGRTHTLLAKKRKRPLRVAVSPECLTMMQLGRGMKAQRRSLLEMLRVEEARQAYIKWELEVATNKVGSRARRAKAANAAWNKWRTAKNNKLSHLEAVLSSPSGRRSWGDFLRNELARETATPSRSRPPPLSGRRPGGRGPGEASAGRDGENKNIPPESSGGSWGGPGSPITASPFQRHQTGDESPTASPKDGSADEQAVVEQGLGSAPLQEASVFPDAARPVATNGREEQTTTSDSATAVAKLHLALESLTRQAEGGKTRGLSARECAEFCAEWPRDCLLPAFFDRALLQPVWLVAQQVSSDQPTGVDAMYPARESARQEAQRLFFAGFLGSSEGQAFVTHTVQDGTLEPTEAQRIVESLAEGAHFDEDTQGFRRIVAHGDEWMHSQLIHEGVEQRVRVETAEPIIRAVLEEISLHISNHRGELAAIVQFVYSLAASRLQPFLRGALARRRLPDAHWETLSYAFLSAAVEIQRVLRGCVARRRAREVLVSLAAASLRPLQARIRGFLVRRRVVKKWAALLERQAVEIQRVFRGHRSRHAVLATLMDNVRAQSADLHGWASSVLQRQARVWLARRAVHLRRVEVGLTSRVAAIADRLASSDDSRSVSAVFGQIDKDYRTYERVIREMKAKEDKMAVTFVDKVLERRDAEFQGAWNRFVGAASEHGADLRRRSDVRRAHPHPVASRDGKVGASDAHDQKLLQLMERYAIPVHAQTLPSAYLRAALPMHLKLRSGWGRVEGPSMPAKSAATQTRPKRRRVGDFPAAPSPSSRQHAVVPPQVGGAFASHVQSSVSSRYAEAYFEDTVLSTTTTTPQTAAASASAEPPSRSSRNNSAGGEGLDGGSERHRSGERPGLPPSRGDPPCSLSGAVGRDVLTSLTHNSPSEEENACNSSSRGARNSPERCAPGSRRAGVEDGASASAGWESAWDTEREGRGLTGDAASRFPGSSARQDLPSGLREGVDRLCAAAFLRGHVPEGLMPKGTAPEEAYGRYLQLPPSLAKIRHEQLCTEASRAVASALRARGYTTLEQLLPPSKLEHLLGEAGAGADETRAAVSLARELKSSQGVDGDGDGGGGGSGGRGIFSPLSPSSRRDILAGSRRSPDSKGGSRGGRGSSRPGTWEVEGSRETRRKKRPLRISLGGLECEGGGVGGRLEGGEFDPSRYTSRPEEWRRPPPSVIKKRWDKNAKTFVPINNYSFDGLYRKHHPLYDDGDHHHRLDVSGAHEEDGEWRFEGDPHGGSGGQAARGPSRGGGGAYPPHQTSGPLSGVAGGGGGGATWYAKRMETILREEYGTFFDGMTKSARELYQHMINDSMSWGSVEDPIGTLLRRAAFYVVEHPSPATKAELAAAREEDLVAKDFVGKKNNLARPIALAGKFKPRGRERDVAQAALAREQTPMGLEAFREFVRELDAMVSSPGASSTAAAVRPYGSAPVDPRRTLLERRLEAAAMLADPFKLRLEADGVHSVKMLARVPARAWGVPPCLVEEIERMLGLLAARTCASLHHRAHGGDQRKHQDLGNGAGGGGRRRRRNNRRRGGAVGGRRRQHLFEFDPRFQRSPIDPFGRPPRLERIQPCLGPDEGKKTDQNKDGDHQLPDDEDDLPSGLWDTGEGETAARKATAVAAPDSSLRAPAEEETSPGVGKREKPADRAPGAVSQGSAAAAAAASGPPPAEAPASSSRFMCRAQPHCGAIFSRASTLRTHENSHTAAPGYHRFRRAPQLGRDRPPAPSEGAGAPAEKFRLRTTLPPSVRRELRELHEEKVQRKRQSLLAGPGLSGTVATWAGVVSPRRTAFGGDGGSGGGVT